MTDSGSALSAPPSPDPRLHHRPPCPSVPPEGLHREEIKALIRMRGSTLRRISLEAGLIKEAVSFCLVRPIPRANQAVSEFLQIPLHVLWPEWFDARGAKIKRPKPSPVRNSRGHLKRSHEKV